MSPLANYDLLITNLQLSFLLSFLLHYQYQSCPIRQHHRSNLRIGALPNALQQRKTKGIEITKNTSSSLTWLAGVSLQEPTVLIPNLLNCCTISGLIFDFRLSITLRFFDFFDFFGVFFFFFFSRNGNIPFFEISGKSLRLMIL